MLSILLVWGFIFNLSVFQNPHPESRDFWGSGNFSQTVVPVIDVQVKYPYLSIKLCAVKKSCTSVSDIRWDNKVISVTHKCFVLTCLIFAARIKTISQAVRGLWTHHGPNNTRAEIKCHLPTLLCHLPPLKREVPHWQHHSQFHNSSTVSPSACGCCQTKLSDCCLAASSH